MEIRRVRECPSVDEVSMESLHLELVYGDGAGSTESLTLETTYLIEIFLSVGEGSWRLESLEVTLHGDL